MGQIESSNADALRPDDELIVLIIFQDDGKATNLSQLIFTRDADRRPPTKQQYTELRTRLLEFFDKVKAKTYTRPSIDVSVRRTVKDTGARSIDLGESEQLKLRAEKIAIGLSIPTTTASGSSEEDVPERDVVRTNPIILKWNIPLHPDYRLAIAQLLYRACVLNGVWVVVSTSDEKNVTARVLAEYMNQDRRDLMLHPKPVTDKRDHPGVYVTGGVNMNRGDVRPRVLDTTLVFDDDSRTFKEGPRLTVARFDHVAARMPNGDIIVAGGLDADHRPLLSCECLTPGDRAFKLIEAKLNKPRAASAWCVTASGLLVVCGGAVGGGDSDGSIEVYDSVSGGFKLLDIALQFPRRQHTITAISDDELIVYGGLIGKEMVPRNLAERINLKTMTVSLAIGLMTPRERHAAVLTQSGDIFVCGGLSNKEATTVEIHNFSKLVHKAFAVEGVFHRQKFAVMLRTGEVLIGGGSTKNLHSNNGTQFYRDTDSTVEAGPFLDGTRDGCAVTSF